MARPTADYGALLSACRTLSGRPTAFVLGSGLGPIMERVVPTLVVPFTAIPGMVAPSIPGHGGTLTLGTWSRRPVLVFSGRLHFYEGLSWERVVRPMEVVAELGATSVILTNASGGINAALVPGSLMLRSN